MYNKINEELSDYLKLLRFKHKKSQEDMAKTLSITRNTYCIWENNPISLSLETLNKITNVMGEDIIIFFVDYVAKCNFKEREE